MACQELGRLSYACIMPLKFKVGMSFFLFLFFFFYPFRDWKLYHDDMHVLVWLCASWCATFLYQIHLRACCVPGSKLSAFCGLLLILIIAFQGKYFHHRMEKPRLRNHIVSELCSMNLKAALSSPKPGPLPLRGWLKIIVTAS